MRLPRPARLVRPALLLALVAGATALPAQQLTVTGQVRDVQTDAPLGGAIVELPEHRIRAVSGPDGEFELRGIPPGEQRWVIHRLGYAGWEQHEAMEDGERLTIRLMPNPVTLETVRVRSDRLARRRITSTSSVRVIGQDEILRTPASSTADLVLYRAIPFRVQCQRGPETDERPCVRHQGTITRVDICIDELPATFSELAAYLREEIYAVEAYRNGSEIRVYTTRFVEGGRPIAPLGGGCRVRGGGRGGQPAPGSHRGEEASPAPQPRLQPRSRP